MWKYSIAYTVPLVVYFSLQGRGWVCFAALIYLFGLLPLLELLLRGNTHNMNEDAEQKAGAARVYDWILYCFVPMQYLLWYYFLMQMQDASLLWWERLGKITAFGLSCGVLGINVAHELGHRSKTYEQLLSKVLLASTLYLHFFIEHNKGHHLRVATEEDPASARKGETVYGFYIRSIRDSWISAWKIQLKENKKHGIGFWSPENQMWWFQMVQLCIILIIYFFFGGWILLYYLGAALMGMLLLETVNYIEHYGLVRKRNESGYYERTMPVHSWNSNHSLGRVVLLELTRHSDHHYQANRKYQILRHFDESPQMPTGYPGMMLLSLIPPLWFWVMHREIRRYKSTHTAGMDLA